MMRLIDADLLDEVLDDKFEGCYALDVNYIQDDILPNIPTVEVPRWILCSERLPDEVGEYLQTIEMLDGTFEIDIDRFEDGRWNYHDMDVVKAWMPKPEPYKGGD